MSDPIVSPSNIFSKENIVRGFIFEVKRRLPWVQEALDYLFYVILGIFDLLYG